MSNISEVTQDEINKVAESVFNDQVETIRKIGEQGDSLIHKAGMYALEQVSVHGNTNPMNKLVSALGKAMRKEALILWFCDYGKVQRNTEDNTLSYVKNKVLKFSFDTNKPSPNGTEVTPQEALMFADEMPFFNYSKEKVPSSVWDANLALVSFFRNASSAAKKGKKTEHMEKVAQLKELFPELAALAA